MSQPADIDVDNKLGGLLPNGGVATYQITRPRARCGYTVHDNLVPFQTNFGAGPQPETAATYDAVTGTAEQVSLRFIDQYGNVMDMWKMLLVDWQWKLDGCPTPLTLAKIAQYQAAATPVRPWPTGYAGAMPGEPTQAYPAWPPATPVPLSAAIAHGTLFPQPVFTATAPPVHDGMGELKGAIPKPGGGVIKTNEPLLGDVLKTFRPPSNVEVNKVYADYMRAALPPVPPGPPPNDLQIILSRLEDMDRRMRAAGL